MGWAADFVCIVLFPWSVYILRWRPKTLADISGTHCLSGRCGSWAEERAKKKLKEQFAKMYLQFYINEKGDKVYTTKKESPLGLATQSAHPARFSPDDKYSRQRVLLKKRFGLLPTQQPPLKY